jgi:hypothetical protein
MAYENAPTSAPDIDAVVDRKIEDAARNAETIGDVRTAIRDEIDDTLRAETTAGNQPAEIQQQVAARLKERAAAIAEAGKDYADVRISHDLPENVGGQNLVGGSASQAEVNAAIVTDPEKLRQVAMHEADPEVGHGSQAIPVTANARAALVVDGDVHDVTTVLEGDVERGVSRKLGLGAETHREDQPERHYGEGQRMANAVIADVGEDAWNTALKDTGDYGALQKAVWKAQLEQGIDQQAVVRLTEEAQITGYQTEAREALYEVAMAA